MRSFIKAVSRNRHHIGGRPGVRAGWSDSGWPARAHHRARGSTFTARTRVKPSLAKASIVEHLGELALDSRLSSSRPYRTSMTSTPTSSTTSTCLGVVALSGRYSRDEADARLARNHGAIASSSSADRRTLVDQSDEEFDRVLDHFIASIFQSSSPRPGGADTPREGSPLSDVTGHSSRLLHRYVLVAAAVDDGDRAALGGRAAHGSVARRLTSGVIRWRSSAVRPRTSDDRQRARTHGEDCRLLGLGVKDGGRAQYAAPFRGRAPG